MKGALVSKGHARLWLLSDGPSARTELSMHVGKPWGVTSPSPRDPDSVQPEHGRAAVVSELLWWPVSSRPVRKMCRGMPRTGRGSPVRNAWDRIISLSRFLQIQEYLHKQDELSWGDPSLRAKSIFVSCTSSTRSEGMSGSSVLQRFDSGPSHEVGLRIFPAGPAECRREGRERGLAAGLGSVGGSQLRKQDR